MNSPSEAEQSHDCTVEVAILGAGPVGLAIATGLRDRGIDRVVVLEKARAFREVGQVVDLLPNGLKALRYLSPAAYEAVNAAKRTFRRPPGAPPPEPWVYRDVAGQPLRIISMDNADWIERYGEGRVSLRWYDLQTALRNQVPSAWIRTNHRCVAWQPESGANYIRLSVVANTATEANPYAHWLQKTQTESATLLPEASVETPLLAIRARLVIAADGINSIARRQLYRDRSRQIWANPRYSGFSAIFCEGSVTVPPALQVPIEATFFKKAFLSTVCGDDAAAIAAGGQAAPRLMMFRRGEQWGYLIHAALPLATVQQSAGSALLDLVLTEMKQANFPDCLLQWVQNSPAEQLRSRPYYLHPVCTREGEAPPWQATRFVLAGDAAHGMPPFMAQGANQGLEDAAALTAAIASIAKHQKWQDDAAIAAAFRQYECLRRPLLTRIQQATLAKATSWLSMDWEDYSQLVYGRDIVQTMTNWESK